jgi:SAM-dependent methyltransferase
MAMAATDKLFVGSIPEIYDRLLVPMIFEAPARDLAQRVAATAPQSVLETAAGSGVLTRAVGALLPAVSIVATDLNQPMLDHAAARQSHGCVVWRQADALALPFDDGSFDAVACQFGAMFFPDKVRAYSEARRVLKPGGRFLFSVWGGIADNEFADAVTEALSGLYPNDPPRFMERIPHGYHDSDQIRGELAAAGFGEVSVEAVRRISKAASPLDAATAFCQGTPLRSEIEARDPSGLEAATACAAAGLSRRFGSGRIEGRMMSYAILARA